MVGQVRAIGFVAAREPGQSDEFASTENHRGGEGGPDDDGRGSGALHQHLVNSVYESDAVAEEEESAGEGPPESADAVDGDQADGVVESAAGVEQAGAQGDDQAGDETDGKRPAAVDRDRPAADRDQAPPAGRWSCRKDRVFGSEGARASVRPARRPRRQGRHWSR